ncbi:MAG: hypothetical protein GKR87_08375 [Kiritimatiellae bacterium]|nr:hypothetical protein [Kiritimatiellia bacterium]
MVVANLLEFVLYLMMGTAVFTVGLKFVENIAWNEAVWQVWQTATTIGYGNSPAVTFAGRNITMFLGILAVAILGVVISSSIDLKQLLSDRRRQGMMNNPYKDGYVIFT